METRKQNILIITAAIIISAGIWIITLRGHPPERFASRVFKVVNGWGYDVLVNDTVIIHQESIPVLQKQEAFLQKDQAEKTAQLIIQKLKSGSLPTLTKFDLEKILATDETNNDRQRKME
jgi:hypothetical protein